MKLKLTKKDWRLIWLGVVVFTLISANELGFGTIAFPPLIFLAVWLMRKAFEQ